MQRSLRAVLIATAAAAAFISGGCGTAPLIQLNDPARSTSARDVANLLPPREIPYETVEKGTIAVTYNLFFTKSHNLSGYRLTLILRNTSAVKQIIQPVVSLQEANGLLIPPYAYDAFVAEAASLAGTVVPSVPPQSQPTSASARGFAAGFAQGMAQGPAIRATNAKEEGRLMLRWANTFWLRNSYELPPGAAASGALFFPAASLGLTPLRLTVAVAGETYTFVGIAR